MPETGDRLGEAVEHHGIGEHHSGTRRRGPRIGIRPAVARGDEAQLGQSEIEHRARGLADILAELRSDEDDDGGRGLAHEPFWSAASLIVAANSSKHLPSVKSRSTLAKRI